MAQMNLSMKQKQNHVHREQAGGCRGGGGCGRDGVGVWGWQMSAFIQGIGKKNKVLLQSTENYIQHPMTNHNGKEYFKKNVYICITESLCCTAEINTL